MNRVGNNGGIRRWLLIASVLGLAACGGQPPLKPGQEVQAVSEPEVETGLPLSERWQVSIGSSRADRPAALQPGLAEGGVYLASIGGDVARFDSQSGSVVWRRSLDEWLIAGVGTDGDLAVVVTRKGSVIALDADDGAERWRVRMAIAVSAVPVVGRDRVVLRSLDGQVIALSAQDGQIAWRFQRPVSSLSTSGDAQPLIVAEGVITGFSTGRLMANQVSDGQFFWEKRLFSASGRNVVDRLIDIDAAPTLADDSLLVGAYQGGVVSLHIRDGEVGWRAEVPTRLPIAFDHARVYATGDDGTVYALRRHNGEIEWTQPGLRGHGVSNPVVREGNIYVGDLSGQLYALDAIDGSLQGKARALGGRIAGLYRVDSTIYVHSSDAGALAAFE